MGMNMFFNRAKNHGQIISNALNYRTCRKPINWINVSLKRWECVLLCICLCLYIKSPWRFPLNTAIFEICIVMERNERWSVSDEGGDEMLKNAIVGRKWYKRNLCRTYNSALTFKLKLQWQKWVREDHEQRRKRKKLVFINMFLLLLLWNCWFRRLLYSVVISMVIYKCAEKDTISYLMDFLFAIVLFVCVFLV